MTRFFVVIGAIVALSVCSVPADVVDMGNGLVQVTVSGAGVSKDDAIRDAQRKAIEEGSGTFIFSESQTQDFALVRDTVLAKAAGFIQSWEALKTSEMDDGTWEVRVKAVVSVQGIKDTWGTVKNLLTQMGRPKVMVFITERIGNQLVEDSTVQTRMEQVLLESGFNLVVREQIKEIDKKDLLAAVSEDNAAKVQAIAKRFGAQIFISGSANAVKAEAKQIYGVPHHVYQAEANVKVYRSDTAQLMSSVPGGSTTGVDRADRTAAKKALDFQAQQIVPRTINDILGFWMEVMQGRGEVQLHVEGIKFAQYVKLKKALETMAEVKQVNAKFSNEIAEASIESNVTAQTLAEKICEAFEDIEITDVSQNVIKAKYVSPS